MVCLATGSWQALLQVQQCLCSAAQVSCQVKLLICVLMCIPFTVPGIGSGHTRHSFLQKAVCVATGPATREVQVTFTCSAVSQSLSLVYSNSYSSSGSAYIFLPHCFQFRPLCFPFPSWILLQAPSHLYLTSHTMNKVIFLKTKLAMSLPPFKTCGYTPSSVFHTIPSLSGPASFPVASPPFFCTLHAVPNYIHFPNYARFSLITISWNMLFLFLSQLPFRVVLGEILEN